MKKELPPSTFDELRPPSKKHKFFEDWPDNRFKPRAARFELVNAWWLSEASLLAYASESSIGRTLKTAGLTDAGFEFRFLSRRNTECFVAHNDDFIMVSFRGTELDNFWGSILDWATDLQMTPVSDGFGGLVHKGVNQAVGVIWGELKKYLQKIVGKDKNKRTLWITGHSLGAALATLAADRAVREGTFDVQGLYTFGSPRIGDQGFKDRLRRLGLEQRTHRFVNNNDIFTRLPRTGIYTHVGALKFIDSAGQLHTISDESQLVTDVDFMEPPQTLLQRFQFLRRVPADVRIFLPSILANHAPVYYAIHIWNNHDSA